MTVSTQFKNKRALSARCGFAVGVAAYDATGTFTGTAQITIPDLTGDFSVSQPLETEIIPLEQGSIPSDSAPLLADDQPISGSLTSYWTDETDAAVNLVQDLIDGTGAATALDNRVAGAERHHFDLRLAFTHPGGSDGTHGAVYQRCVFTSVEKTVGEVNTAVYNWRSLDVKPTIKF